MKKIEKRIGDFRETRGIAYQAMHQFSIANILAHISNFVNTHSYTLRELIWIR
jgi:uncharacterized membrane protein